jgi:hypothetical protein
VIGKYTAAIDGEWLRTPGIDWGPKPLQIMHRKGKWIVTKWHGHNAWTGRFSPSAWCATSYMLMRLEDGQVEEIKRVEPGKKWRQALKDLIAEADKKK